ncbi:hypothetical protein C8R45DRAFT_1007552 [Mycena sanguinolenta]|nr:hypothetical protein C8R45DRAFT_1007552 [Mycena sanguinolenta]
MATIVERPLSAFSMSASPSVVPHRRRRDSIEIIDVDSFEEPNTRPVQRRRVEQEQPDIIELLDSDDEPSGDTNAAGSSGASHAGSRRGSHFSTATAQANSSIPGPSRSRHFISPPPPVSDGPSIPPVPSLPQRYSAFASFPPTRPRPARVPVPPSSNLNANEGSSSSSAVPGPVRASSRPFAFELASPPAPRSSRAPAHYDLDSDDEDLAAFDLRPAPPARHNPPMGFGGALISYNNARLQEERLASQRRAERRAAGGRVAPAVAHAGSSSGATRAGGSGHRPHAAPGNSIMRRLAALNPWRWGDELLGQHHDVDLLALADDTDERTRGDAQLALDMYLQDHEDRFNARFSHPARGFARRELALLRGWRGGFGLGVGTGVDEEESYRQEWTHPASADAGFVFDFAPSEIIVPEAGAGNGKGKGKEVVIDAEKEKEGVSTLLVCARCLDPLLVRADGDTDGGEAEARKRRVWGLRCGHVIDGKCLEELRRPVEEDADAEAAPAETTDERAASPEPQSKHAGKGKGKAKARDVVEEEHENDELFDEDAPNITDNSIRSRLRSRGSGPGSGLTTFTSTATPSAFEIAVPLSPRKRAPPKRKGKGKGRARPMKPVVEARYDWTCPVAGCGRIHTSEKIDGVWVNAPEKGAIGMFV